MLKSLYLLSALTVIKVACNSMGNSRDGSTYANIGEVYATNIDLDIQVNFTRKVLDGNVEITFNQVQENATSVWLDSEGMYIYNVEYGFGTHWRPANYFITRPNDNLGNAIEVLIPTMNPTGTEFQLRIRYTTND